MGEDTGEGDAPAARVRGLWEELAAAPVAFPRGGGVAVALSPGSRLCPPSWAGVVRVGDAVIATAPDERQVRLLRGALADLPVESAVRAGTLRALLPVAEMLGPATLAYASGGFYPVRPSAAIVALPVGHAQVRALTAAAGPDDTDESGLPEVDSPVFAVREGSRVLAAAAYRRWPASTAHLSVLTAPGHRGRGLAREAASAAASHALSAGLLLQWRARTVASRRVAAGLGFREAGEQVSVRLS